MLSEGQAPQFAPRLSRPGWAPDPRHFLLPEGELFGLGRWLLSELWGEILLEPFDPEWRGCVEPAGLQVRQTAWCLQHAPEVGVFPAGILRALWGATRWQVLPLEARPRLLRVGDGLVLADSLLVLCWDLPLAARIAVSLVEALPGTDLRAFVFHVGAPEDGCHLALLDDAGAPDPRTASARIPRLALFPPEHAD